MCVVLYCEMIQPQKCEDICAVHMGCEYMSEGGDEEFSELNLFFALMQENPYNNY